MRCLHADRTLNRLQAARPEVEIEKIEVLQQPLRVLRNRIYSVPAIVVGENRWYSVPAVEELIVAVDTLLTESGKVEDD